MKLPNLPLSLALVFVCLVPSIAQKQKQTRAGGKGSVAIVVDETLSVLRAQPSLYATPVQRMRRGRRVQILGSAEADGVKFLRVAAAPAGFGWVQADAVFAKFRFADEERFAKLVLASSGFDQIELAAAFLDTYPASKFRPTVLLLVGDLLEDAAAKLSRDANSRLKRSEMAASGAPLHSYYLNFNLLDRYRRLGATFLFNASTRTFHYNGAVWRELIRKHPLTTEASEAARRLDSLKMKLERQVS